jgi:hypothetical protein
MTPDYLAEAGGFTSSLASPETLAFLLPTVSAYPPIAKQHFNLMPIDAEGNKPVLCYVPSLVSFDTVELDSGAWTSSTIS